MSTSFPGGVLDATLRPPRTPRLTASQRRRLQQLLDDGDSALELVRRAESRLRDLQDARLSELKAVGSLEERARRRPSLNPNDPQPDDRTEILRAIQAHHDKIDRLNGIEVETRENRAAHLARWNALSALAGRVLAAAGYIDSPAGRTARQQFEGEF